MNASVLSECVSVYQGRAVSTEDRILGPLGLEVQMVVSHHMDAWN